MMFEMVCGFDIKTALLKPDFSEDNQLSFITDPFVCTQQQLPLKIIVTKPIAPGKVNLTAQTK
jgi:hypothetical protein